MKIIDKAKILGKIIAAIGQQFYVDGCFGRAASLAYTTLLSMVPLLAVGFGMLTRIRVFNHLAQRIQEIIFQHLVASSASAVQSYIQVSIDHAINLSIVGTVFLVITAVLLVFSMENAFNAIWRVKRNRHGVFAFLLYWAIITLIPSVIGIVLILVSYIVSLPIIIHFQLPIIDQAIGLYVPYVVTFMVFTLLFSTIPNCRVPLFSAVIAALVTTVLFELARRAFAIYIGTFAEYQLIYGALAAIPIFLVWLYVSWLVILFGGVVSYVITERHRL